LRRKRISSRDLRLLVIFIGIVTVVTSGVAYRTLNPPPSEQFFAMWILGFEGLAQNYYPDDNPNLAVGEELNWTLGIYNHMRSIQYVVVRVKVLNSTLVGPDDLTGTPSPITPLYEFTRVLLDNETWSIPFIWNIQNITQRGPMSMLSGLLVNQIPFNGELAMAVSGFNYRLVFELWFYDQTKNDLAFSWREDDSYRSVWTQVWFNATTPSIT